MLKIALRVPADRQRAGAVEIIDGSQVVAAGAGTASADAKIAKQRKNPDLDPLRPAGHAPFGHYALRMRGRTPAAATAEYGPELLLFEPISGQATDAESYGRLSLLVYAGHPGRDMHIRRTQGGVRLDASAMAALLSRLGDDTEVTLDIDVLKPKPWWAFWRKRYATAPLSKDPPRCDTPPLDEQTLSDVLAKAIVRRPRAVREYDDDHERSRHRESESSSSSSSTGKFSGGGGTGGGGGASAAWGDAPGGARGAGVDAAGRIIGAAGVAAVAGAALAAAQSRADSAALNTTSASAGDTPSSDSSRVASGEYTGTQTSTAY